MTLQREDRVHVTEPGSLFRDDTVGHEATGERRRRLRRSYASLGSNRRTRQAAPEMGREVLLFRRDGVMRVTEQCTSTTLRRAYGALRRMFGRTLAVAPQLHPAGREASGFA